MNTTSTFPRVDDRATAASDDSRNLRLLVVGLHAPVASDYVAYRRGSDPSRPTCLVATDDLTTARATTADRAPPVAVVPFAECDPAAVRAAFSDDDPGSESALRVIVFADGATEADERRTCEALARLARTAAVESVRLVHGLGASCGDRRAQEREVRFRRAAGDGRFPLVIWRCAPILAPHSAAVRWLQRAASLRPLLDDSLATPFVPLPLLAAALDESDSPPPGRTRLKTLLGPRRSWAAVLDECDEFADARDSRFARFAQNACRVLRPFGSGIAFRRAVRTAMRRAPERRAALLTTLTPGSIEELVGICNRFGMPHVQLAGYDNGVTHFGWRFPGRTVVRTVGTGRRVRVAGDETTADAGATLQRVRAELRRHGRDVRVAPNYSYVAVGTAFFVPIHGSGSAVSTLGETIGRVLVWDPLEERFVRARRGTPEFESRMYDRGRPMLLLRLSFANRPAGRYRAVCETRTAPTADELLFVLAETGPSNVELRKARADRDEVDVRRYYEVAASDGCATDARPSSRVPDGALDLPQDRIGRTWDRIEETPILSSLFHWFVRTRAFHVELFLSPDEFRAFWSAHRSLPLRKIQLRRVHRDGLPHSAMRDGDRISVDLFLMRRHRDAFLEFVRRVLPGVRTNPGKQSL